MKRKMLILTNRTLHNGPRMIREFQTFKNDFDITAFGLSKPLDEEIHYEDINQFRTLPMQITNALLRRLYYKKWWSGVAEYYPLIEAYILKNNFDAIIIHDPTFLPLISRLKSKHTFLSIYNAHEYHPLEFEDKPQWTETIGRYLTTLYKNHLHDIDLMINVCEGIAQECEKQFQKKSLVIPNVAIESAITPTENTGIIKLIYHGAIMQSRNIEDMIDVMKLLGNGYSLDIMGMVSSGNENYFATLKQYASQAGNVFFKDAVPFHEIVPTINQYDIGLFLLRPNNFNYTHALPNKLYEFIQAKLAIAVGPSVEMKRVVMQYQLGVVSDDFGAASLATAIKQLDRTAITQFKQHAVVASAIENAAHYANIYLQQVKTLMV